MLMTSDYLKLKDNTRVTSQDSSFIHLKIPSNQPTVLGLPTTEDFTSQKMLTCIHVEDVSLLEESLFSLTKVHGVPFMERT
jgi:hypothetical protein